MLKYLAYVFGIAALLAAVPAHVAPAKQAPVQTQDKTQAPAPKQGPANSQTPQPAGPQALPPTVPPEQAPTGPALDKLSASLKQIETSLERHDLTDADLLALRQQIDPISEALANALDRLTPGLDKIKARLDQLGPKPDDSAPPESPEVTEERAAQQKLYDDTSELSKRARLLAVEVDQTSATITARRRALFTRSLFAQAESIANPALWAGVRHGAPGYAADIKSVFSDWIDGIGNRLDGQRPLVFWSVLALILLLCLPRSRLAWRLLERGPAASKPNRFRKILWCLVDRACRSGSGNRDDLRRRPCVAKLRSRQYAIAAFPPGVRRGDHPRRCGGGNSARLVCSGTPQLASSQA